MVSPLDGWRRAAGVVTAAGGPGLGGSASDPGPGVPGVLGDGLDVHRPAGPVAHADDFTFPDLRDWPGRQSVPDRGPGPDLRTYVGTGGGGLRRDLLRRARPRSVTVPCWVALALLSVVVGGPLGVALGYAVVCRLVIAWGDRPGAGTRLPRVGSHRRRVELPRLAVPGGLAYLCGRRTDPAGE